MVAAQAVKAFGTPPQGLSHPPETIQGDAREDGPQQYYPCSIPPTESDCPTPPPQEHHLLMSPPPQASSPCNLPPPAANGLSKEPCSHEAAKIQGVKEGVYIAFEGINGVGKTTLINNVVTQLTNLQIPLILTREPGGTPLGQHLRRILLEEQLNLAPITEVLLFAAERAQHLSELVIPSLASGKMVISDRSLFSSIAFQGYGRGYPIATIESINLTAVNNRLPDLVILLDLEPHQALQRSQARQRTTPHAAPDRFEDEEMKFHSLVRDGFTTLAAREPSRWIILDAQQSPEQLTTQAVTAILERLSSESEKRAPSEEA